MHEHSKQTARRQAERSNYTLSKAKARRAGCLLRMESGFLR